VNFGFVRQKEVKDQYKLFINNTEYSDSLSDPAWTPLENMF